MELGMESFGGDSLGGDGFDCGLCAEKETAGDVLAGDEPPLPSGGYT